MLHPLIEDIEKLKTAEIEHKINDLTKKYFMTNNVYLKEQIATILNIYTEAVQTRRQQELENAMKNKDKDLDKLININ